jgi:hypothetical protein
MSTRSGNYREQLLVLIVFVLALIFVFYKILRNNFPDTYALNTNANQQLAHKKVLVLYAYLEKKSRYDYSQALEYFINLGVEETDKIDYLFIIQGAKVSVDIPKYKNVKILHRPNDW